MNWPRDKDGELLERLKRDGVDFNKRYFIEFNVDFQRWPPSPTAMDILKSRYGVLKVFEPGQLHETQEGYVSLKLRTKLSYELVTEKQREITESVIEYGGYCDSWAVLQRHEELEILRL